MIRKTILLGAFLTILVASNIITNINTKTKYKKRLKIVENYIECLNNNCGQRYYCAKQQNMNYQIIDQYAEEFGYEFNIDKAGNLFIIKEAE